MCPGPAFLSACPCLDLPMWPLYGHPVSLPGPVNREVVELAHYLAPCHWHNKVTTKVYKFKKEKMGERYTEEYGSSTKNLPFKHNSEEGEGNCSE